MPQYGPTTVIPERGSESRAMVRRMVFVSADLEEQARVSRMAQHWDYYYGQQKKPLKPVKLDDGTIIDDNIVINFPRLLVDKGVSFLFGQGVEFETDQVEDADPLDDAEEKYLDQVWKYSKKKILLHEIATNGGVCGHTFVRMSVDGEKVRLINVDPQNVSVYWDPSDYEIVQLYKIQWHGVDLQEQKVYLYRELIRHENPEAGMPTSDGSYWSIVLQRASDEVSPQWVTLSTTVWPYSWAPIFNCKNLPAPNQFYGMSDIEDDVCSVSHGINFVVSNINRILRNHAHPKSWTTGYVPSDGKTLKANPDSMLHLPNPEAKIGNLEMNSDLSSSIELYKALRQDLHLLARMPELAMGKVEGIGSLSGSALQVLYQPLIEKTATKQDTYGSMLGEINSRLLEVGGYGVGRTVTNKWPDLIPQDPAQEATTAQIMYQLGFSYTTLIKKLGGDPKVEKELRAAEGKLEDKIHQVNVEQPQKGGFRPGTSEAGAGAKGAS